MPFTLYHAGPGALISLPLRKYLDVPVFILSNVIIDLEVLIIAFTGWQFYSGSGIHPIAHTFLFGSIIAILWGVISIFLVRMNTLLMNAFKLDYQTNKLKIMISALLGVWFHIIIDCMYHSDLHPLYPFSFENPLNFGLEPNLVMNICRISFAPAIILFFVIVIKRERKLSKNES